MIWVLCKDGKLPGAKKMGNAAWLIPRASVESYVPGRRGPRTGKERLSAEMAGMRAAAAETKRAEGE
jgi:hypothetical protein